MNSKRVLSTKTPFAIRRLAEGEISAESYPMLVALQSQLYEKPQSSVLPITYIPEELRTILSPIKTEEGYVLSSDFKPLFDLGKIELPSITIPGVYYDYEKGEFVTESYGQKQMTNKYINIFQKPKGFLIRREEGSEYEFVKGYADQQYKEIYPVFDIELRERTTMQSTTVPDVIIAPEGIKESYEQVRKQYESVTQYARSEQDYISELIRAQSEQGVSPQDIFKMSQPSGQQLPLESFRDRSDIFGTLIRQMSRFKSEDLNIWDVGQELLSDNYAETIQHQLASEISRKGQPESTILYSTTEKTENIEKIIDKLKQIQLRYRGLEDVEFGQIEEIVRRSVLRIPKEQVDKAANLLQNMYSQPILKSQQREHFTSLFGEQLQELQPEQFVEYYKHLENIHGMKQFKNLFAYMKNELPEDIQSVLGQQQTPNDPFDMQRIFYSSSSKQEFINNFYNQLYNMIYDTEEVKKIEGVQDIIDELIKEKGGDITSRDIVRYIQDNYERIGTTRQSFLRDIISGLDDSKLQNVYEQFLGTVSEQKEVLYKTGFTVGKNKIGIRDLFGQLIAMYAKRSKGQNVTLMDIFGNMFEQIKQTKPGGGIQNIFKDLVDLSVVVGESTEGVLSSAFRNVNQETIKDIITESGEELLQLPSFSSKFISSIVSQMQQNIETSQLSQSGSYTRILQNILGRTFGEHIPTFQFEYGSPERQPVQPVNVQGYLAQINNIRAKQLKLAKRRDSQGSQAREFLRRTKLIGTIQSSGKITRKYYKEIYDWVKNVTGKGISVKEVTTYGKEIRNVQRFIGQLQSQQPNQFFAFGNIDVFDELTEQLVPVFQSKDFKITSLQKLVDPYLYYYSKQPSEMFKKQFDFIPKEAQEKLFNAIIKFGDEFNIGKIDHSKFINMFIAQPIIQEAIKKQIAKSGYKVRNKEKFYSQVNKILGREFKNVVETHIKANFQYNLDLDSNKLAKKSVLNVKSETVLRSTDQIEKLLYSAVMKGKGKKIDADELSKMLEGIKTSVLYPYINKIVTEGRDESTKTIMNYFNKNINENPILREYYGAFKRRLQSYVKFGDNAAEFEEFQRKVFMQSVQQQYNIYIPIADVDMQYISQQVLGRQSLPGSLMEIIKELNLGQNYASTQYTAEQISEQINLALTDKQPQENPLYQELRKLYRQTQSGGEVPLNVQGYAPGDIQYTVFRRSNQIKNVAGYVLSRDFESAGQSALIELQKVMRKQLSSMFTEVSGNIQLKKKFYGVQELRKNIVGALISTEEGAGVNTAVELIMRDIKNARRLPYYVQNIMQFSDVRNPELMQQFYKQTEQTRTQIDNIQDEGQLRRVLKQIWQPWDYRSGANSADIIKIFTGAETTTQPIENQASQIDQAFTNQMYDIVSNEQLKSLDEIPFNTAGIKTLLFQLQTPKKVEPISGLTINNPFREKIINRFADLAQERTTTVRNRVMEYLFSGIRQQIETGQNQQQDIIEGMQQQLGDVNITDELGAVIREEQEELQDLLGYQDLPEEDKISKLFSGIAHAIGYQLNMPADFKQEYLSLASMVEEFIAEPSAEKFRQIYTTQQNLYTQQIEQVGPEQIKGKDFQDILSQMIMQRQIGGQTATEVKQQREIIGQMGFDNVLQIQSRFSDIDPQKVRQQIIEYNDFRNIDEYIDYVQRITGGQINLSSEQSEQKNAIEQLVGILGGDIEIGGESIKDLTVRQYNNDVYEIIYEKEGEQIKKLVTTFERQNVSEADVMNILNQQPVFEYDQSSVNQNQKELVENIINNINDRKIEQRQKQAQLQQRLQAGEATQAQASDIQIRQTREQVNELSEIQEQINQEKFAGEKTLKNFSEAFSETIDDTKTIFNRLWDIAKSRPRLSTAIVSQITGLQILGSVQRQKTRDDVEDIQQQLYYSEFRGMPPIVDLKPTEQFYSMYFKSQRYYNTRAFDEYTSSRFNTRANSIQVRGIS